MKLPSFLRWSQRDTSSAARQMALAGVERRKAVIRAKVDAMRAEMGMEPVRWPS